MDNTTTGEVDDTGVGQTQSRAYAALRLRRGSFVLNDASTALHDKLLDTGVRDKHGAELQPQGEEEEVEIWPGDVFQVGGVFVMGPGNTCDYVFRSEYAGDHPSLPDVVQAATGKTLTGEDYLYPSTAMWAKRLDMSNKKDASATPRRLAAERSSLDTDPAAAAVAAAAVAERKRSSVEGGGPGGSGEGGGASAAAVGATVPLVGLGTVGAVCAAVAVGQMSRSSASLTLVAVAVMVGAAFWWPRLSATSRVGGAGGAGGALAPATAGAGARGSDGEGATLHGRARVSTTDAFLDMPDGHPLITTKEIDDRIARSGMIECDCSAMVQGIPVLGMQVREFPVSCFLFHHFRSVSSSRGSYSYCYFHRSWTIDDFSMCALTQIKCTRTHPL